MGFGDLPLLSMLKSRLGYISQRETLIAQNVANSDTPGYAPKDLKAFTIADANAKPAVVAAEPARTNPGHLSGASVQAGSDQWKAVTGSDSETKLDGNKVVLEDEMSKMTQSRMDYEAAIGFYEKALQMLSLASRAPGHS